MFIETVMAAFFVDNLFLILFVKWVEKPTFFFLSQYFLTASFYVDLFPVFNGPSSVGVPSVMHEAHTDRAFQV